MKEEKRPSNPNQSMDKTITQSIDESTKELFESFQDSIVFASIGMVTFFRWAKRHYLIAIVSLYSFYVLSRIAVKGSMHLELLHKVAPDIFTLKIFNWFLRFTLNQHHFSCMAIILFFIFLCFGFWMRSIRERFIKFFTIAGLKNGSGDCPKLVHKKSLDRHRTQYEFDANGIGISEFTEKKERLEASFGQNIEAIKHGKNQKRVIITLNKQDFPERIEYTDLWERHPLPPNNFFVGHTANGLLIQDISELPHLLIAGATGTGKSVFFKQVLMGLLESTPSIQMYLIDLKGGLEMKDFSKAPNVKIVKTVPDALDILEQIKNEVDSRIDKLDKLGRNYIIPEKDNMPRVIVGIDEASILYMKRGSYDPDKNDVMKARQIADSISKLSRVVDIHLILATQKVEGNIIPTSVTENISGKMAFRANSFQGSIAVLGCKDAVDLPEVVGRGIWKFGITKMMVQAPCIDSKLINEKCSAMSGNYAGKMIDHDKKKNNEASTKNTYDYTKKQENKEGQK